MTVVHADDLVLLLVGWEVMGICSYLLVGHHSERPSARAAAVKAFLVTRVGDLGVLIAVVVLLLGAGTTSIQVLVARAGQLPGSVVTTAALLLLAGVAGKSAQFPLHTWLPDAMEGPTPVSALIHAATMVAAGVYLVARLLPVFLAAPAALDVAAVIASITMLGAALAALAQDDLKRLLAWSTISQVAYMLAGVSVARSAGDAAPGVFHLLSHAGFKALLFLVAGCVTHLVGSTQLSDMGGLRKVQPRLALLLGLGLAALAGIPPLGGFWSKEAVLTAAEDAALAGGGWPARLVLASGLLTTLVTGVYAGRAYALVAMGEPPAPKPAGPDAAEGEDREELPHTLPWAMRAPLWVLAVPTLGLGLLLIRPPGVLQAVHVDVLTAFTGSLLSLAGVGWAMSAPRLGGRDVADALPDAARAFLREGYRLDAVQRALIVRPYRALARVVALGDRDVVDAYPRGSVVLTRWAGVLLRRAEVGLANGYVAWAVVGAVAVGLAGVVLS
ncbi:MAG TPA: NADH-quinone oxidoreductase subunit L, partial [Kineosporiaceae bacterium]|nr:NADH-quinone oxidoreductase subunit L [Kineosporiaceae bacterium]